MTAIKKKYQLPLAVLVAGFVYGGYCFYSFVSDDIPKMERRLHDKEGILNGKSAELRKLRNFSENVEAVKQSLRDLNGQLETLVESMPRSYDLSGLLRKLSVISFNSGIELSTFRPGGAPAKEGEFYETVDVSFALSGSFTQVMSFFDQALRLKRLIRIDKVTMKVAGQPGTAGVPIGADVVAKLYRFLD